MVIKNFSFQEINFNFDVKPILSDKCYTCHGPDDKARKANLRLDIKEGFYTALEDNPNHFVIDKNNPNKSEILKKELDEKIALKEKLGVNGSTRISSYLDEIAASVPAAIQLTELSLNPVEKKIKDDKVLPWKPLTRVEQLDTIETLSKGKTQVIFKHSTRCGISRMVINQFIEAYDVNANLDLYYLDLLCHRDVSNEVGYKFQVMHESPQLLIIKNGVTVAHASHGGINGLDLEKDDPPFL